MTLAKLCAVSPLRLFNISCRRTRLCLATSKRSCRNYRRAPQAGTLSSSLAVGSTTVEQMLRAQMTNTIVLSEGALVPSNEADRPSVSALKGLGLNLAALPCETLYVFQDGITVELRARESHALQVLSEQKINMEQLSLQHNEVVSQNQ